MGEGHFQYYQRVNVTLMVVMAKLWLEFDGTFCLQPHLQLIVPLALLACCACDLGMCWVSSRKRRLKTGRGPAWPDWPQVHSLNS